MAGRQSAAVAAAIRAILRGVPRAEAAKKHGVSMRQLQRAIPSGRGPGQPRKDAE